jgi:hypothetical protein
LVLRVPPPADTPSPRLPDYELLRLIGRGSYGDVWLARAVTGVFRAVKIIWRERFPDERPYVREFEGVTRFAAISLREPSQLALLHAGRSDDEGFFYYVMELADDAERGRAIEPDSYVPLTLRELRLRRTMLPPAEVVALGVALSRGLATLHRAGLVHRDIKPSNVVLIGGVPKLADIGLVAAASAGLTFVGTEGFVPPEGSGTPAADVYSLGKVLYELATGLDRHDWPRLPPELVRLPERRALLELNEVLVRACEPDPRQRFVDAGALLDELLLLQAGKSVRRLRAAERRTTRALRVAASFAIVSAIAGSGAWIEHQRAASETDLRRQAEAARDALARETVYTATLVQAQRAIEREDYGQARRLLEALKPAGDPDRLAAFEWRALSHQARGDPCAIVRPRGAAIDRMALDPEGRFLAVHDEDKRVTIYDARNFSETRRITNVQRLAGFSADGEWLFGTTVEPLGAPQRWRVATGHPAASQTPLLAMRPLGVQGNHRMVACIDARPASGDRPSRPLEIVVWDFEMHRAVSRFPVESEPHVEPWQYFRSAILPSGNQLAIACVQGRTSLARFRITQVELGENPRFEHQLLEQFLPSAMGVYLRPHGPPEWWATEMTSGRRLVYDSSQRTWQPSPERPEPGTTFAINVLRQEQNYVFQAQKAALLVTTGSSSRRLHGHDSLITDIVCNTAASRIFTSSQSGEVRSWNFDTIESLIPVRQCRDVNSAPTDIVYSADSRWIFAPADGNSVSLLDAQTLAETGRIPGMSRPIAVDKSGVWGLSENATTILRWDRAEPGAVREFRRAAAITHLVFSPSHRWLGFLQSNGTLSLIDLNTVTSNANVMEEGITLPVSFVDKSPRLLSDDGSRIWSTTVTNTATCHEIPSGKELWQRSLPARPTSVCRLAAEGKMVIALENGDIVFLRETDGTVTLTVPSGSAAAQAIFPSPDETRLFAAGIEGELHVIRAATGTYLTRLQTGGTDPLHRGAIAPDSSAIAAFTKNGLLRLIRTSQQ